MNVVVRKDCPGGHCTHRAREDGHVHVELLSTGQGLVLSGGGEVIDVFDLAMPARLLHPGGADGVGEGCRWESFGRVHVKPGCRCAQRRG